MFGRKKDKGASDIVTYENRTVEVATGGFPPQRHPKPAEKMMNKLQKDG